MRAATALLIASIVAATPNLGHAEPDDPSTSPSLDRPCTEETEIIGYRHCQSFGSWGQALLDRYVFIELGMNFRHYAASEGPTFAARSSTPMSPASSASERTFVERIGVGLPHHLYVAFDFEPGPLDGARIITVDGLFSLGIRARLGPGALAAEIAGGAMSTFPAAGAERTEAMAEVRGRAYLWISPWCTVGAVVGSSMLRADWMAGFYIGLHTHAFAGDR